MDAGGRECCNEALAYPFTTSVVDLRHLAHTPCEDAQPVQGEEGMMGVMRWDGMRCDAMPHMTSVPYSIDKVPCGQKS